VQAEADRALARLARGFGDYGVAAG
jgi:hypothetical protein